MPFGWWLAKVALTDDHPTPILSNYTARSLTLCPKAARVCLEWKGVPTQPKSNRRSGNGVSGVSGGAMMIKEG